MKCDLPKIMVPSIMYDVFYASKVHQLVVLIEQLVRRPHEKY